MSKYLKSCTDSAHTNNEINSEKNHETYTCFLAVVGGQHIVKLTTSLFAPQILFKIYFACWLYLFLGLITDWYKLIVLPFPPVILIQILFIIIRDVHQFIV